MTDTTKKQNWITRLVANTETLLDAIEESAALRQEYDSLNYGMEIGETDTAGANAHVTPAQITNAMYSLSQIQALIDQGHGTNLYRLKP